MDGLLPFYCHLLLHRQVGVSTGFGTVRHSTQLGKELRSNLILGKVNTQPIQDGGTPTSVQCIMLGTKGEKPRRVEDI